LLDTFSNFSGYAGTAFTMLKMFGLDHEVEKLLGGRVDTLSNVLTLSQLVHKAFDTFGLWLEEVPGEVRFTSYPEFFPARQGKFYSRKILILW
jgi:HNH endonuclease